MGCCNSTPTNTSPYEAPRPSVAPIGNHNDAPDSSRAAITTSSRALNHPTSHPPTGSSSRPNQRIRAPSPLARSPKNVSNMPPPWTRSHLEREREAFFDTRVTGQTEAWSALDLVCSLLRKGELDEAQGILDAAGLSVPNGRVARGRGREKRGGVYDERGVLYEVPEWVVQDPGDVVEDEEASGEKEVAVDEDEEDEDEELDGEDKETRRPKGKGRAEDIGEEVQLRARLSDRGSDVEVTLGAKQPVRIAVQKIREQTGCNRVRLVYMGKPMDESRTLRDCGWRSGQVVNAFVFEGDESVLRVVKKGNKKT